MTWYGHDGPWQVRSEQRDRCLCYAKRILLVRLVRPHPGGDEPAAWVGDRFKTLYFRSGRLPFRGNLVDDVDAFGPPKAKEELEELFC